MFYAFLEIEKTYIEICDKKCQNSISKKKNNLRHVKYFGVPEIIDNFIFYWNASSSPSPD